MQRLRWLCSLINLELWPGSEHCREWTEEFLSRTLLYGHMVTEAPLLVRMDSGNDSLDNIKVCRNENAHYIIKRNLRKETTEKWLKIAMEGGQLQETRQGKREWIGEQYVKRKGIDKPLRIVFRVTLRTTKANGQQMLIPEVEVETYWTSLNDDPATVIRLYHAHGTSEQFHSELKTDMDLERLPSGKFDTNEVVLLLGMVAYNIIEVDRPGKPEGA